MLKKYKSFLKIDEKICPYCLERHQLKSSINENLSGKISSLQINVPLKGCVNNCKSCIAKIHNTQDKIRMLSNTIIDEKTYLKNLKLIRQKTDTAILTSDNGEPIQNINFIKKFGELNKKLDNPFKIEIQTTGVLFNDFNISILKDINLNVVSLSIFDIFDNINNLNIINVNKKLRYDIINICKKIKESGFVLRLSLNLIKEYEKHSMESLFKIIDNIKPDQLTFKVLWCNEDDNPINQWIKINKSNEFILTRINNYIINNNGKKVENNKYVYNGISIFLIKDCMDGNYLIIRNDGELYDSWLNCNPIKINENIDWTFIEEEFEDFDDDFIMFKGQHDFYALYVIKNLNYGGLSYEKNIWCVDNRVSEISCYSSLSYAKINHSYIPSNIEISKYLDIVKLNKINKIKNIKKYG